MINNPYERALSSPTQGIEYTGDAKGYPTQTYHKAAVLVGFHGQQDTRYGFSIPSLQNDYLSLPSRLSLPATMVDYTCWYKINALALPKDAPKEGMLSYELSTSDTVGSLKESTVGFSIGGSLSNSFLGLGASISVENSISYTEAYQVAQTKRESSGVSVPVGPGQRGQLWMGQKYVKLTCDLRNLGYHFVKDQAGANQFFSECLLPVYQQEGHTENDVIAKFTALHASRGLGYRNAEGVKMDLARLAIFNLPNLLSQELILNAAPMGDAYPTYSPFNS